MGVKNIEGDDEMSFENKVAVITGSARGIGRNIALTLARAGCNIVIADLNLEGWKEFGGEDLAADSVEEEVKLLGQDAISVVVDVTNKTSADEMIAKSLEKFGKVDILVNNAGGLAGPMSTSFASSMPEDQLKATVERNLYGTIFCSQAVAPHMKERKYGKIVNFGSQAGLRAQPGGVYAPYGVAKAGVTMYTHYLAQELGPFNINVNAVVPAYVGTHRLNTTVFEVEENKAIYEKEIAIGRIATPEDIAKVVKFLVDDDSSYVTGQCLSVCGGVITF